jgi:hypothetical protein
MVAKILGAVWPLIIFPFIMFLNLRGSLDFGAGEKDIVLAIPMLAFSIFYLVAYIILIKRKQKTYVAVITSSLISFFLLVLITLIFSSTLGVKG